MSVAAGPRPRSEAPAALRRGREQAEAHPWIWSFVATALVWVAIAIVTGNVGGTLTSALAFAPFLVLVGVGQMFVITAGYGSIDLSVPYVVTLAAFVSVSVMDGSGVLLGLLAGLACGLVVAVANVVAIQVLSIPPIVATLAVGLMAQSAGSVRASSFGAEADPGFQRFLLTQVGPVRLLAVLCVLFAVLAGFVLHRTGFGRSLQAAGQNRRAADLSGVRVGAVLAGAYLICGLLAGLTGALLGSYTQPSLDLGDPYLLNSIAVVVLGGTLIQGGRSNVPGVWGGTLFLVLLVTLLGVLDINVAVQNIVKGVLIILVLALASGRRREA
jgi:ribose transport system permease protein